MSATQKWLGRIFFRVNSTVPVRESTRESLPGGSRDTHTVCTGKVQQNLSPPLNKVVQVLQVNLNFNLNQVQDLHEHTGFTAPRVETKKLTPPRTQSRSIRDYKSSNVALPDDGWPVAANELASGHTNRGRRATVPRARISFRPDTSMQFWHWTRMQARVHLCMAHVSCMRTRRVSMDGVNAISALPQPAWYRLFWPARRRILFAELVRLPPSNVACPGRQPI